MNIENLSSPYSLSLFLSLFDRVENKVKGVRDIEVTKALFYSSDKRKRKLEKL
jgi:hypothetical protein